MKNFVLTKRLVNDVDKIYLWSEVEPCHCMGLDPIIEMTHVDYRDRGYPILPSMLGSVYMAKVVETIDEAMALKESGQFEYYWIMFNDKSLNKFDIWAQVDSDADGIRCDGLIASGHSGCGWFDRLIDNKDQAFLMIHEVSGISMEDAVELMINRNKA